jgi:hypothetical protein
MGEDRLTDLEGKVKHLEYDEIAPLKKDINNIKINLAENNLLTKQTIESNEKLSDTMNTMRDTMVEITQSLKNGNRISGELTESVKALNGKVESVENKMEDKFKEIDEKAKIDWQQWVKNNWFGAIMGIGAILYAISQFMK